MRVRPFVLGMLVASPLLLGAQSKNPSLPLKHAPQPTTPKITAADLMTRLYIFADDSMEGRKVRTIGNVKGTNYIAAELKKLGLEPAGEQGTYFQTVPYETVTLDATSALTIGGRTLTPLVDFVASAPRQQARSLAGASVIYGGLASDTMSLISAEQAAGKVVLVSGRGNVGKRFSGAVAIGTIQPGAIDSMTLVRMRTPGTQPAIPWTVGKSAPLDFQLTRNAAESVLGGSLEGMRAGTAGGTVQGDIRFVHTIMTDKPPARNVVAILRGSDPKLNHTYVAIGAHNDHIGVGTVTADHDSLRTYKLEVARRMRSLSATGLSQKEVAALRDSVRKSVVVNIDSLRKIRPARRDSISNGADDDGSGTVSVLEIAEALTKLHAKPKRSILFVFHTGEEAGLHGSKYFTANPTVPRDSIISQVNIDMVGRGSLEDTPEGGPNLLMAVGSHRLSTELGDLVDRVNVEKKHNLRIDYTWDAPTHPEGVYFRSDHYEYAKFGIPIVFFFTGLHVDYHQVTDEPQYIDYTHMAKIDNYIYDLMLALGNLPKRPLVDKPIQ